MTQDLCHKDFMAPLAVDNVAVAYASSCRLQRLSWLLRSQLRTSKFPQFVEKQRQELLRALQIALLDLRQRASHIGHAGRNPKGEENGHYANYMASKCRASAAITVDS